MMNMGFLNKGPWFWIAGAASIGIHIVLVSIFCVLGGGDKKPLPSEEKKKPVVVEKNDPPSAKPIPADESQSSSFSGKEIREVVKSTSKPKAVAKPVLPKTKTVAKPISKAEDDVSLDVITDSSSKETADYVVKPGDSLYKIARDFSCTVAELAKLNNTDIKKLSNLKKGQKIRVPKTE